MLDCLLYLFIIIDIAGHPKQPQLPLIRLRLYFTDESQMFNTVRFGQRFEERVVNTGDMLLMKKRSHDYKEKREVLEKGVMKDVLKGAKVIYISMCV